MAWSMGVDLGAVVPRAPLQLRELSGRVVAIDAYNTLYQFLSSIRQPDGTPLLDAAGRVTSHLSGLFYRTANLVEAGVRPVFVWDGKPHPLKGATLEARAAAKAKAEAERQAALASGDLETALRKAKQTSRLDREMVSRAARLLDALGIPHVAAPAEGEAQASHLVKRGDAWAAVSQDFDALLFGAPRLIRNLALGGRRKLPGRNAWVDVEPELIDLDAALRELGLDREQLIALAMLCGTDFNPGIHGVGPKKGLKLLREHRTLAGVLQKLGQGIAEAEDVRRLFLEPEVTDAYRISWRAPDESAVMRILVEEHGFSRERVEGTLHKYRPLAEQAKQKSLDAFFS